MFKFVQDKIPNREEKESKATARGRQTLLKSLGFKLP